MNRFEGEPCMKYGDPVLTSYLDKIPSKVTLIKFATGCDFGGTKERWVLFGLGDDGVIYPVLRAHWPAEENTPLSFMVEAYHSAIRHFEGGRYKPPKKAGFGLAGPIEQNGKICRLTNSDKIVSTEELKKSGMDARLYNDFYVNVAAVPVLTKRQTIKLEHSASAREKYSSPIIIAAGPGTGTGAGLANKEGKIFHPRPSEGGHSLYGPPGILEDFLVTFIRKNITGGRPVECEQVASNIGVSCIFKFFHNGELPPEKKEPRTARVRELMKNKEFKRLYKSIKNLKPQQAGRIIIEAYRDGFAELKPGIDIFVDAAALTAINLVQVEAAYGGTVYILGGNTRRTLPVFEERFMKMFDNPYVHDDKLRGTAVYLVPARNIGSMGAASLLLKPEIYRLD